MDKYLATIDGGIGGTTALWADTAHEALQEAMAWATDGDWTLPAAFRVRVVNDDNPEDAADALVELEALP